MHKVASRKFDALPDTVDFRDKMYVPTLIEVGPQSDLAAYRAAQVPVLDQGREGACTGFALATVVNYLLRISNHHRDLSEVSARMLYVMAKRYDEWPGEEYDGSSARGAMKGWHKHGVSARSLWPDDSKAADLDENCAEDALNRPLGAYFRVNHKDLVSMHSAIAEAGVLLATARVHQGWMDVRTGDETIDYSPAVMGGHAFAIVGYDHEGLWIQNSWSETWGSKGLARLSYADWLENGTDVWVARLGAPINLSKPSVVSRLSAGAPRSYESHVYASLRPHVVTAGNDGRLMETGAYGLTREGLRNILARQLPETVAGWKTKRVAFYAHGGLVPSSSALQYIADYREYALKAQVYPLAIIWRSDVWSTLRNILQDALSRRKDEGVLDAAKDFMLDRLDDTMEPTARLCGGKALWDEMKENATLAASKARGAARMVAEHLVALKETGKIDEIHLVGHSAGSVLLAPLAEFLAARKVDVSSLTLWAPACTMKFFDERYLPLITGGKIKAFDLFTLDDATERDDDCAGLYNKSLLYLVSGAFEDKPRIPLIRPDGTPLLGLARDVGQHIADGFWNEQCRWLTSPTAGVANARHHGELDNDELTMLTTLERITGGRKAADAATTQPTFGASKARIVQVRQKLDLALGNQ